MSEIGLNINVDSYNNEGIKTIKGNNNAEIYKLYILKNKRRLSLVGKTVKLGYVMVGTTNGDVIENLNITNAEQGEITFPITNRISKKDGVYSCQLAIYGADGFLEHTATFGLTVEANIFTKIAGEIADSKDFTYLENILDKSSKLNEKLKENTSSATNANSNLESNITEANNINSKLLENTSTATSLNKNLESNIDLAKEVKETIKDLDTKNIEATEKIETLRGLNAKATELSNNIQQALPLNSELVKNTESAKVANTNLLTTNQEAVSKNTELQASLEKTKEFIEGLDGSQNIPQIRMDVTELQNGLKSNQALAYTGSSISADNTLEGRTEGMRIGGRTLVNLCEKSIKIKVSSNTVAYSLDSLFDLRGKELTIITDKKVNAQYAIYYKPPGGVDTPIINYQNNNVIKFTVPNLNYGKLYVWIRGYDNIFNDTYKFIILEGDWTNKPTPQYFEGLKSFGESEQEGDKYKISILSKSLNNIKFEQGTFDKTQGTVINVTTRITSNLIEGNFKSLLNNNLDFKEFMTIIFAFDLNKRFISTTSDWSDHLEISNLPINTKYIRIVIKRKNEKTISPNDIANVYFGESNKKDILIKEPLKDDDVLYEDNGQVKVYRPTKQYTFTGDENFQKINVYGDVVRIDFACDDIKPSGYIISNNFAKGIIGKENLECINIHANSKYIQFQIKLNKLTSPDVEGFKAWLKANPTTIVYQLAEPVTEVVENCVDIDLDTFQDKTYFNILNSLPGTLDFKVPSNIGSVVQNMAKEVNNIWDVINNLLVPGILDVNKKVALATIKNNLK